MVENVDKLHQAFDTKVKSVVEMCSQVEDQLQGYTLLLKIAEQQTPLQQRRQEEKGKLRSEAEKLVDNDLGAKTTLLQTQYQRAKIEVAAGAQEEPMLDLPQSEETVVNSKR